MKKIKILTLLIFALTSVFAQTDKNGNPIFNSQLLSEEQFEGFELTSSYYTIDNNISNKNSSVYVTDKPSLNDYLKFARDLPSNFFIIHQRQKVIFMIMLIQKNEDSKTTLMYNILNPNNGKSMQIPCNVWGEISEKRASELLKLNVDTSAKIIEFPNNGKGFLFNGIAYRIQLYSNLKSEVIEIAKELTSTNEVEIKDTIAYIRKETIGGNLDFNKLLENEKQPFFLYEGVLYNKKDFAIFLWGKKVKQLGISSSKKATILLEEINNSILTEAEKKALVTGFESKAKN